MRSIVPYIFVLAFSLIGGRADSAPHADGARELAATRPSWPVRLSLARADGWEALRPEMTRAEVLRILGAPPWTERTLLFEFWMYEFHCTLATGVVVFDKTGVFSWRRPAD